MDAGGRRSACMPLDERLFRRARIRAVLRALPDAPSVHRRGIAAALRRHREALLAVVLAATVLAMILS